MERQSHWLFHSVFVFVMFSSFFIPAKGQWGEVTVVVGDLTAIAGNEFYVLCQLRVPSMQVLDKVQDEKFEFTGDNLNCSISPWKNCSSNFKGQMHGHCSCYMLVNNSLGDIHYKFYMYMQTVTPHQSGSLFTCSLGRDRDQRHMQVVTFTRRPKSTYYACRDKGAKFDWEFNPTRVSISRRFNVFIVQWTYFTNGSNEHTRMGTLYRSQDSDKPVFHSDGYTGSSVVTKGSVLPQLHLADLTEFKGSQYVQINVTFNITDGIKEKRRQEYHNTATLIDVGSRVSAQVKTATVSTPHAGSLATTATKSTTSTTTAETNLTFTAPPIHRQLITQSNYMTDTIEFIVADAPSAGVKPKLAVAKTVTNNLLISCTVTNFVVYGYPKVNLTIWADDVRLISRQGVSSIHYSAKDLRDSISCGFEGPSLECVEANDSRRHREKTYVKDISYEYEEGQRRNSGIDMLLFMYSWNSIVCIILILWTVSLLLDHIRIILRVKKEQHMSIYIVQSRRDSIRVVA